MIGPTCSLVPDDIQEQCFEDDTEAACKAVGGTVRQKQDQFSLLWDTKTYYFLQLLAQRFCLIPGTDWTLLGPNAWQDTERINDSRRFCRELQDDIPPYEGIESYDIGGRFCLVKKRLPPLGPYCLGNTCYQDNATSICDANGGEMNGPFMCTLPSEFRRAEGPLIWNDEVLPTSAPECNGGLFCAIPETNPGENLRCPGSCIGEGCKNNPKNGPNGPNGGSSAVSKAKLMLTLGLVVAALSLW